MGPAASAAATTIPVRYLAESTTGDEINRVLLAPPATAHAATLGWYAITASALALSGAALRDRWHRYARVLRRP